MLSPFVLYVGCCCKITCIGETFSWRSILQTSGNSLLINATNLLCIEIYLGMSLPKLKITSCLWTGSEPIMWWPKIIPPAPNPTQGYYVRQCPNWKFVSYLVFILGINSPLAVFVIMYTNGGYANYASISLAGCAWQVASKTEGSSYGHSTSFRVLSVTYDVGSFYSLKYYNFHQTYPGRMVCNIVMNYESYEHTYLTYSSFPSGTCN